MKSPMARNNYISMHGSNLCGCSVLSNPKHCVYQRFLDGWDFTPEVGMGDARGEIFTPRFIVDQMITDSGLLPKKVVYQYDYKGSQDTLRKYVGHKVFEPAVGTGNYSATVLWHKLEMAHELTGYTDRSKDGLPPLKSPEQLRRYQAYTLVALGSIYFNDIDPGNLQTTKWRLYRDGEILSDANVEFWTNQIENAASSPVDRKITFEAVAASIKAASENWGRGDRDRGVLDVLYEKHTGLDAPEWLQEAWKHILDKNGLLFNSISLDDSAEEGFTVPGYSKVKWVWWKFTNNQKEVGAYATEIPMLLQVRLGELRELEDSIARIINNPNPNDASDIDNMLFGAEEDPEAKLGPTARAEVARLKKKVDVLAKDINRLPKPKESYPVFFLKEG